DKLADEARSEGVRRVGERIFSLRGSVWTDVRYVEGMRTVRVKAFSPLYFELISRLTGLSEALTIGDQVIVAGRKVAIAVGPDGEERLGERELTAIVAGW